MLTIADAASRLAVSERQLRRLMRSGQLAYIRITERRRGVTEADLAAYIESRRVAPWQSASSPAVALSSNLSRAEHEFFAACTRLPTRPMRKPSKLSSAAIYSLKPTSGSKPTPRSQE